MIDVAGLVACVVFLAYLFGTIIGANLGTLDYPPRQRR